MIERLIRKRTLKLEVDIDNLFDRIIGSARSNNEVLINIANNKKYFKKELNKLMIKYEKDIELIEKKESKRLSKKLIDMSTRSLKK